MWDEQCDVLVIGSGAGGMTGAYTAGREGLSTILVESSDRFGGTTAYSGGGMWFPCSAALKRAGVHEELADAAEYYKEVVGTRTSPVLQDQYLTTGRKVIDYLEKDSDLFFVIYPWADYYERAAKSSRGNRHIVPAPLNAAILGDLRAKLRPTLAEEREGEPLADELVGGQALIGRFLVALSKLDRVDLRLNTPLVELIREDGRVTGAVVGGKDGPRRIRARRGVLVAAGGFERNAEMRARYGVPGHATGAMAPPSNTGVPIEGAIAIGADTDLMDQGWWSPGLMRPNGRSTFTIGFNAGIFVDAQGQRFMNESAPYDRAGRDIIAAMAAGKVNIPFWFVYDDSTGPMPPIANFTQPFGNLQDYIDSAILRSADTLPELAEAIGVPAEVLNRTVERFNGFAAEGIDPDFGRGDEYYDRQFTDDRPPLVAVSKAPFHAIAFGLSDLGTKGGLRTDELAHVLDGAGQVIPGLYAAGNSMAAVSGETYPGGGIPIGSSMVFSFLAAMDMAAAPVA